MSSCFNIRMRSALVVLLVLGACDGSSRDAEPGSAPGQPTTAPTSSATPPKDGGTTDGGPHTANESLRRCAESKGDIGSIADVVTRLNAVSAKGGDGACLVATLPRPLAVVATLN